MQIIADQFTSEMIRGDESWLLISATAKLYGSCMQPADRNPLGLVRGNICLMLQTN